MGRVQVQLVTEMQTRFAEQMIDSNVLGDGRGYVKFIESFGSDERIIESARMSTGKGFLGWEAGPCPLCSETGKLPDELFAGVLKTCYGCEGKGRIKGDKHLLFFLWMNKHATPFEMGGFTIEVKAPIMVFREWHRHRTQSYNEFSARYSEMPEEFYVTSMERLRMSAQSQLNKQGSGEPLDEISVERTAHTILKTSKNAFAEYQAMLRNGVAKEVARLVLPVNTYSKMRASTDLRNWFGFLTLRDDSAAQWEIQQYAGVVDSITEAVFPRSHMLYSQGREQWREFIAWKRAQQIDLGAGR